jgi:hypothetical protein
MGDPSQARSIASHGKRVYVAGRCDGRGFLRVYRARSGRVLWDRDDIQIDQLSMEDGRVYAVGPDADLAALARGLDPDSGDVIWEARMEGSEGLVQPILRVAARGGVIFVAWGDYGAGRRGIEALDARSGRSLWKQDPGYLPGAITSDGTRLFAGAFDGGFVRAYDAETGAPLWRRQENFIVGRIEVKGDSLVIAGSGTAFHLNVVDAASGSLRWDDVLVTPRAAGAGSIVLRNDRLFVGGWKGNLTPPLGMTQYLLRAYDAR